jgi:hypothetical protein
VSCPHVGSGRVTIPTTFPTQHPVGDVVIVGDDGTGLIAESEGFRYYLTDCCLASAKGSMGAVVCRCCYREIDDALGGIPPQ